MNDTPSENFLAALHATTGEQPNGNGCTRRCPAHDDQTPSLSVSEGDDGRVLLHCHAGCTVDAICTAVGLNPADLFVPSTSTKPRQTRKKRELCRQDNERPAGKTFPTAHDAIAELEQKLGPHSAKWTYHDADENPVGVVVRWDKPDGKKDIRPVSRHGDAWIIGGMPEPRPLYGLPDLADANRVYVPEGETAADAARSIGLTATTSAHGAQSPLKTDWSPLAGKEVVILPDNDQPGQNYADTVAAILAKLTPAATVKKVDLPGLLEHGDIVDWIDAHGDAAEPDELKRQVEALADEAETIRPDRPATRIEPFKPFPVDALPQPTRGLVVAGANAIGCDPSYIALPMLTVLAAAIGNTRRLQLKRGWSAPAILWTAIVGESGTAKTPAFKLALRPIRERQRKALERHAEAMRQYESDLLHYEKRLAEWKKTKNTLDDPPTKPEPPQAERSIVGDTTAEALAPILLANPRGVLQARDELAGWIGGFDRYAAGKKGADAATWLSMHNAESVIVDRKTGNQQTIFVPQASLSITGGIQPVILDRVLGIEHRESGLAARLLLTCPPRKPKRWTEADIDPAIEDEITRLIDRLYELQPMATEEDDFRPVVVGLTRDAKSVWKAYYNAHGREQMELVGELSAAWSKLEEYAARLALVIHFARWAAGDPSLKNPDTVDVGSMEAGIRLATWFKGEARRVYAMLSESGGERDQRRLLEWIQTKGGSVTTREVQQGCRWLKKPGAAEPALNELAKAGYGCWRNVPTTAKGGQPTRVFRLSTPSTVYETPTKPDENGGSVDVDSVDAPETQSARVTTGRRCDDNATPRRPDSAGRPITGSR